jgi:hypothetical protein
MSQQLRFLVVDHRQKPLMVSAAAASRAWRQWRERPGIVTAELAPQPLDASNPGCLAL